MAFRTENPKSKFQVDFREISCLFWEGGGEGRGGEERYFLDWNPQSKFSMGSLNLEQIAAMSL